jgi:hypothetical protein
LNSENVRIGRNSTRSDNNVEAYGETAQEQLRLMGGAFLSCLSSSMRGRPDHPVEGPNFRTYSGERRLDAALHQGRDCTLVLMSSMPDGLNGTPTMALQARRGVRACPNAFTSAFTS